ncbi:MAG: M20 family metallo-hydrolase [Verrucomicrobiota bacterium]
MSIDRERLLREIDELATISSHPAPAVTRVLFSPEDLQARRWLLALAEESGFTTRQDAVGNLFIRWEGSDPTLAPVATGSHTDAIPNAGKFDGVVGVLGGLEAMRTLKEEGFQPLRPLELIMFTAEEPTRFGIGCLGSRLMAGTLDMEAARTLRDPNGSSLDEIRASSCTGQLEEVALKEDRYHAFVELHIEQGPILEAEGIDIGVVEKIAAPAASRMSFSGSGGHAGAVLMPERKDAFLAAAEVALAVEKAALDSPSKDAVGTTGVVRVEPGAINSIPCEAMLEIDFRDTDLAARDAALKTIQEQASDICERREVTWTWEVINADPPALCDPELVARIDAAADAAGCSHQRMISRAYHDSLFMARVCPTSMIFIPCHRGYSHRPDEFSSPDAISKGVQVLANTLKALCR